MPGIRIQHDTERNTTFTLVDMKRPLRVEAECGYCHRTHQFKTYHIRIDETGASIVSHEVWDRLQRIDGNPFRMTNVVENPPPQIIRAPLIAVKVRPIGGTANRGN